MKKLAIAIPTYNEKDNIRDLIITLRTMLHSIKDVEVTVIIIDDNSPDGTGKIADALADKYNQAPFQVTVMHRKGKLGLASAYIEAFIKAIKDKFDYILSMDADFSHQPKYISDMLEKIKEYDLVIGSRNIQGGGVTNWNLLRRYVSRGGSLYARTILGVDIKDFTGGFNLYKREILEKIDLHSIRSTGYAFLIEIKYRAAKAGARIIEIPIIFPNRTKGKAKMSSKIFLEAIFRVWQIKYTSIKR